MYSGNPGAAYDASTSTHVLFKQGCGGQPAGLSCGDVNAMTAPTPHGPWTYRGSVANGTHRAGDWDMKISNAVPHIEPNGTTWLMWRSHGYTDPASKRHFGEHLGLYRADSWRGPFAPVVHGPLVPESNEDPFVWRDRVTGAFHALTHLEVAIPQPPGLGSTGGAVGGRHIWSVDGLRWHSTTAHLALGERVALDNGTVWVLSRRERPFVLFEADGSTPRVVFNGVQLQPRAHPHPRTFVLAQPVRGG